LLLLAAFARAEPAATPQSEKLFQESIAPIFERRCVSCHSGDEPKGGLSLASAEALRKGGESGPAIVTGKSDESLIVSYISGDEPEMPKGQPRLSASDVAAIRQWVEAGAPWPAEIKLEDRSKSGPWWSLAPLVRPAVPEVSSDGIRTPIDSFILAKQKELGLRHAAEADRRMLIRRLSFDLHGLPPTPEEVDAFLADVRPDAYKQLVDRLLASPRCSLRRVAWLRQRQTTPECLALSRLRD
jgi:mono/diheme cytochrome c family protein